MSRNIIVINVDLRETRVALIEDGVIAELHIERAAQRGTVGNVVLGRVTRVLPGMQAAFIDVGQERAAFLHVEDLIRPGDFDEYLAANPVLNPAKGAAAAGERAEAPSQRSPDTGGDDADHQDVSREDTYSVPIEEDLDDEAEFIEPERRKSRALSEVLDLDEDDIPANRFEYADDDGAEDSDEEDGPDIEPEEDLDLDEDDSDEETEDSDEEEDPDIEPEQDADSDEADDEAPDSDEAEDDDEAPDSDEADDEAPDSDEADDEAPDSDEADDGDEAPDSDEADDRGIEPAGALQPGAQESDDEDRSDGDEDELEFEDDQEVEAGAGGHQKEEGDDAESDADAADVLDSEDPARAASVDDNEPEQGDGREGEGTVRRMARRGRSRRRGGRGRRRRSADEDSSAASSSATAERPLDPEERGVGAEERPQGTEEVRDGRGRRRRRRGAADSEGNAGQQVASGETEDEEDSSRRGSRRRRRRRRRRGGDEEAPPRAAKVAKGGVVKVPPRVSRSVPITEVVKEGNEVVVQITKEPIGTKGARVTSHVSLPGRYVVYLPTVEHTGISKRIGQSKERVRLRKVIESLKPATGGLIVRTVAEGLTKKQLKADVGYLIKVWAQIADKRHTAKARDTLYEELDLVLKVARDYFTDHIHEVVIDDRDQYGRLVRFVEMFMPARVKDIKLYTGDEPVFDAYGIEDEIKRALSRKVPLRSGGSLIMDQAEALTAIDVNTGRYVGKGSKDLEETALKTNLEAVDEIAYQLRFRNIGGLVILDLIDMERSENREKVWRALEQRLAKDKAKTTINRISELGLIEMTRKRTRESLGRIMNESCFYCDGTGHIQSRETIAYEILRQIRRERQTLPGYSVRVSAHPAVTDFLKYEAKVALDEAERRYMRRIELNPRQEYHIEQFDLQGR